MKPGGSDVPITGAWNLRYVRFLSYLGNILDLPLISFTKSKTAAKIHKIRRHSSFETGNRNSNFIIGVASRVESCAEV